MVHNADFIHFYIRKEFFKIYLTNEISRVLLLNAGKILE